MTQIQTVISAEVTKHCRTGSTAAQEAVPHRKHCRTGSTAAQEALRHRKHYRTGSSAATLLCSLTCYSHGCGCAALARSTVEHNGRTVLVSEVLIQTIHRLVQPLEKLNTSIKSNNQIDAERAILESTKKSMDATVTTLTFMWGAH